MEAVLTKFMDEYGLFAFGTVAALLLGAGGTYALVKLWKVMVMPILEQSKEGQGAFLAASANMSHSAMALQAAAESNLEATKQSRSLVSEQKELVGTMRVLADRLHCEKGEPG